METSPSDKKTHVQSTVSMDGGKEQQHAYQPKTTYSALTLENAKTIIILASVANFSESTISIL